MSTPMWKHEKPKRNVLAFKAMPSRPPLHVTVWYVLASKVYELPAWCDAVAIVLLSLLLVVSLIAIGEENQVDPMN
jgi:hypothetical protein